MEEVKYKICCFCKKEKQTSDFHSDRKTPDHLSYRCKECKSASNKDLARKNIKKFSEEGECQKVEKICSRCRVVKPVSNFFVSKSTSDHRNHFCRECMKIKGKLSREQDPEKKALKYAAKWRENNKEKRNKSNREYIKKRIEIDPSYKLMQNLRSRLRQALKHQRAYKVSKTATLLGCTYEELKQHLESQFTEGMTWDNHGEWHVDHKKPIAMFDLSKEEDQRVCFHYTNLQPLWAEENIKKSSLYEGKRYFYNNPQP